MDQSSKYVSAQWGCAVAFREGFGTNVQVGIGIDRKRSVHGEKRRSKFYSLYLSNKLPQCQTDQNLVEVEQNLLLGGQKLLSGSANFTLSNE